MIQNASSARETIEQMVKQSGITKKLAAEILHAIADIIEEGLKKDGEVRVKGLGTFRLRWIRGKMGRNPKTGERVEIPSHNRVVFLPEQAFKEYINRDNRLLNYKIIPPAGQAAVIEEILPEPEPLIAPEPEHELNPPIRKRRIHWIIPVAASVIIILSLVFYYRNFYQVGGQRSAVSGQRSAVSGQQSAVSSQKESEPTQNSELKTPNSALSTKNSELKSVPEGTHLFKIAREIYGNPYLWVLIYKKNLDKITDPDMVVSGMELLIPALEGKPDQLTRNDSLAVSEGYRLVYEFYRAKDESRAGDFSRAMKRYKPL